MLASFYIYDFCHHKSASNHYSLCIPLDPTRTSRSTSLGPPNARRQDRRIYRQDLLPEHPHASNSSFTTASSSATSRAHRVFLSSCSRWLTCSSSRCGAAGPPRRTAASNARMPSPSALAPTPSHLPRATRARLPRTCPLSLAPPLPCAGAFSQEGRRNKKERKKERKENKKERKK
jgi:hypothetical protein